MTTKRHRYLAPLSTLYGVGTGVFHWLYNSNLRKAKEYDIPILCVGNIAVGGTGKSPMVEYLVRYLKEDHRVAVISRGYKRKSRGMVAAGNGKEASAVEVGDELRQLLLRHPDIDVVADVNRQRAIEYLLSPQRAEQPDVIIMDDGMQHRRVKPSFTLMLTSYDRPFMEDKLLPQGRLRENAKGRLRADCIIVTKCPPSITPIRKSLIKRNMSLFPHQSVFFTSVHYREVVPLFSDHVVPENGVDFRAAQQLYAIAGIAHPDPFFCYLKETHGGVVETNQCPDHHAFTKCDIAVWNKLAEDGDRAFVTTDKDAARLHGLRNLMSDRLIASFFVLPIEIHFLILEKKISYLLVMLKEVT